MSILLAYAEQFWDREYYDTTLLHPLAFVMLVMMSVAMLTLPRQHAVLPVMVLACLVATAQRITIFTLDFNLIRCVVLVGWIRVLARGENKGYQWKKLDTAMLLWGLSGTLFYILLHRSAGAVVYRLGWLFDGMGMYFLFRCLIQRWRDFEGIITAFLVISIPVAIFFAVECVTRHNLFSIFGGVPEVTMERQGKLRCQGAFSHPILAGCFWVGVIPWIATRWWQGGAGKFQALAGIGFCGLIVLFCNSSTPIGGLGLAMLGAGAFLLRRHMRRIRWGILLTLVGLHLVMKAPVWHLLGRIDIVGGSTGYHRYALIDAAVRNFREWAIMGTRSTGHWGYYLFDVTNMYIAQGVQGGFLSLVLFIAVISYAYQGVGRLTRLHHQDRVLRLKAWSLGVSLFAHTVMFIGVSYFGQIISLWFLQLAIIGSLAPAHPVPAPALVPAGDSTGAQAASATIEPEHPEKRPRLARVRY